VDRVSDRSTQIFIILCRPAPRREDLVTMVRNTGGDACLAAAAVAFAAAVRELGIDMFAHPGPGSSGREER
jgi:hypothetical protein